MFQKSWIFSWAGKYRFANGIVRILVRTYKSGSEYAKFGVSHGSIFAIFPFLLAVNQLGQEVAKTCFSRTDDIEVPEDIYQDLVIEKLSSACINR